ncbi:Zinc finger, SWIM-type [Phytophthora cactorum]|nr:Zinc finger, SWIM-type [Phytophthora cactorum]
MGVIVSQLKHCTVCRSNLDQHHMRYRIYCCKSSPLKTLTCERTKQSHLYQHDQHFAASAPDQRPQLSLAMKAAIRELVVKDGSLHAFAMSLSIALRCRQFLLEGGASRQSEFHCRSLIDPEDNARNAEEGEWNNRRMERLGQPMIGWTVNLSTQTCGCRAFYKFGACVHLLASLKHANRKIAGWPGTKRRFVDRRVKRSKPSTGAQRGRPARVSQLLAWTSLVVCL